MRAVVKRWGNSAAVRLPAAVLAKSSISLEQAVDVREEDGRIIIEPIRTPVYDLSVLLAEMTPDTFHDEADYGAPVGEEIW